MANATLGIPEEVEIDSIRFVEDESVVCDLTIADNHNLFVSAPGGELEVLAHNCLNENRKFLPKIWFHATKPFSLQALEWHYGYVRSGLAIDKDDRKNMGEKSLKDLGDYGVIDVLSPFFMHLAQMQEAKRVKYKKFMLMAIDQCGSTSKVIARMENVGNLADLEYLQSQALPSSELNQALAELEETFKTSEAVRKTNRRLTDEAGHAKEGLFGKAKRPWVFSIRKPDHRHKLFFDVMKLAPVQISQKTQKPSTGKKFQDSYKLRVPEVAMLEEYTKQFKLRSAFVDSLLNRFMDDPDTSKDSHIRSSYSTLAVVTGRLSSFNVNLQNIPSRGKLAKIIKRIFISGKNRVLLKCDYSAHEVRVLGIVSKDDAILALFQAAHEAKIALRLAKTPEEIEAAIARFKREGDIHISNVRLMFNQEVDKDHPLRQSIKTAVFGTIYAMGAAALAAQLFTVHETEKNLIKFIKKNAAEQVEIKKNIAKISNTASAKDRLAALKGDLGKKVADHRNLVEQLRRKRLTEDEKIQEAAELMNKLFSAWPTAASWMDRLKVTAERNLTVSSPIGRVRHLSGYLHFEKRVKAAMGRRAANSVIQGMASEQATMSGHITGKLLWDMFGPEGKMDHKLHNMVHDSQMWSCPIHLLPVMAYFVEHGMTTLMRQHYQTKYKVDIPIPYGIDMEFGLTEGKMHGWNMRADSMHKIGDELLKETGATKKQIAAFKKNATLVGKIREFEMRKYPDGGMSKKGRDANFWQESVAWEV
jgi:DNA polymerase I-like protein with 3'-5' exonuclease and polymerase domains